MVVCRFYLNGKCKFGDRCRNEHPRNISDFSSNSGSFSSQSNWQSGGGRPNYGGGGGRGQYQGQSYQQYNNQGGSFGSSFGNRNRFAALGDDYQRNNRGPVSGAGDFGGGGGEEPKPGEILESIKRDAEEWDASGMWPYSSYRPARSQGDVPGLQDVSPEELRLEAYLAQKENRFEEYKGAISTSASVLQKKREMLKKPSGELQKALISVYRGQHKSGSFGSRSIFGVQDISSTEIFSKSGSSLFQTSNNPPSGFSSTSPPAGLFSTSVTSGTFGKTNLGSGFGASVATPSTVPQGLFSAPSGTTSSFGSLSPQSSGFGSSGGSGFGTGGGTGFGSGGGFGSRGSGLFGKPAETQAPVGLFGKPVQAGTGLFGKPATQGGGLFGKGEAQATGLFGKPAPSDSPSADSKCYTPLSDLTPEEKEQFEAPSFTLGKIPTRPPPLEMVKTAA